MLGLGGIAGAGFTFWPDEGVWNPCLKDKIPKSLLNHELVQQAWEGIDPQQYIDCHLHMVGTGDSDSGIWLHPDMQSPLKPAQYIRFKFYMNATCMREGESVDTQYVSHLLKLQKDFPNPARFMLLAFDYIHNNKGEIQKDKSPFAIPNEYVAKVVQQHPAQFTWAASIHPYRTDAVEKLEWCAKHGARAVKWLPPMMNIDPSSHLCEPFYEALIKHDIALLTHAGDEHAVAGVDSQRLGNPLLLRKPLEMGVKVIVAHCATLGKNTDIDKGANSAEKSNYELFARLMDEKPYDGRLFGDISAIPQVNREAPAISDIISRQDWHHRLLNGSDYPLPGVMPVFSTQRLVDLGLLDQSKVEVLKQIRLYNPILYDFVLKRSLRYQGKHLSNSIFETGRILSNKKNV